GGMNPAGWTPEIVTRDEVALRGEIDFAAEEIGFLHAVVVRLAQVAVSRVGAHVVDPARGLGVEPQVADVVARHQVEHILWRFPDVLPERRLQDRKSTRLNSSHVKISYAVFCLKKKK